ncbi:ligand-binding sensor domain-containing protein [Brumimicrobium mesophilum]|uniref:ligand-binding sensor domain-containing protein n=1 Tax=Brumimicrobium mesophilum TaxID=392717 RepID=UPI000D13FAC2|nr:two-component regulator propeller domain-containing protein [Brumimicrobium mesophilum]
MKIPLSTLLILLLFSFCNGQKSKSIEIKEPKFYTDADIVTSSLLDNNGNLWFGTSTEGLYKYDGEKFSNFNEKNTLCTNQIWDIIEDDKGIIWLATNKGLCNYDGKTFTQIPLPYIDTSSEWYKNIYPTVNPNQANSIIQDKKGTFWIGTSGGGAYKYDGTTFDNILADKGRKYEDSLHHNVIQSIIEDKNGNIWFASMSNGGITRFDGETFQDFKNTNGLSDNMVRYLYQDIKGNIWIGTNGNRNGGLDKFDGNTFTNFNEEKGLCSNNIAVILQSSNGKIWLGSDRAAICYYENGEFTPFEELSGISIRTIIEDKKGNIWFGGRKGNLWKYNGEKLTDLTQLKNE